MNVIRGEIDTVHDFGMVQWKTVVDCSSPIVSKTKILDSHYEHLYTPESHTTTSLNPKDPSYTIVYSWPIPAEPEQAVTEAFFSQEVADRLTSISTFKCPMCLKKEVPNPTIIIPCGHVQCHDCLEEVLAIGHDAPSCPSCYKPFVKVTDLECFTYVLCPERLELEALKEVSEVE
ncbi:hypothetical protein CC86DRAFT_466569 [Ophiobolus disseminans]|uniref:RING-type domain-containing protein n=1 Tax=Ophiobolus disseminans TaxID=1469910 RepID=A0A6A7A0X6_9PLEO|nr:hypothetical protein CC86DRAFT_466569 [Ophiobolus disseminans]